ncbi:MAG: hypothetical protein AB8B79_09055 [Granulosicoccus sp.]
MNHARGNIIHITVQVPQTNGAVEQAGDSVNQLLLTGCPFRAKTFRGLAIRDAALNPTGSGKYALRRAASIRSPSTSDMVSVEGETQTKSAFGAS